MNRIIGEYSNIMQSSKWMNEDEEEKEESTLEVAKSNSNKLIIVVVFVKVPRNIKM